MTNIDEHHGRAFFLQMQECRPAYRRLGEAIHRVVGRQESALELGCGIGLQTRLLLELGWGIIGTDYAPAAFDLREPGVEIQPLDLTKYVTEDASAVDCVICTETAEHLEEHHADAIVQNVAHRAKKLIVWSAAAPGQEWEGHINLQPPAYWLKKFSSYGWVPDMRKTELLRKEMCDTQAQHWMGSHNFFVLVRGLDLPSITVISTVRNACAFIMSCRSSVVNQKNLQHVNHVVIDAGSTDGTRDYLKPGIHDLGRYKVIFNDPTAPKAALENLYEQVQMLPRDEVVVWLDGDDWLAHDRALEVVAEAYRDPNVWLTFGQFMFPDGEVGFASPYPPGAHARKDPAWRATHLKTFRAGLFQQLTPSDLQRPDGSWCDLAIDRVVMYPLLELAGDRHRCMYQVLSVYNYDASWHKAQSNAERQRELDEVVRLQNLPPKLLLIQRPF